MMSTAASAIADCIGLRELTFCALILVTVIYLKHLRRYSDYWRKQNVVHEEFDLSWAPISKMLEKPIHEIDMDRHRKYGNVFGSFEGLHPTLFLSDPDLIKLVLVKYFNDFPDRRMNAVVHDCARATSQHLTRLAEEGKDLHPKEFFGHYALNVITRCVLGARLEPHTTQADELVAKSQAAFTVKPMTALVLFFYTWTLFPFLTTLLRLQVFIPETFVFLKKFCLDVIEKRKPSHVKHQDFLQLMVDAQGIKAQGSAEGLQDSEERLYSPGAEETVQGTAGAKALTEEEALSQCIAFFIAGLDTISSVLAFTSYLLALHPDIQKKLQEEVDRCFKENGEESSLAEISKLKYLDCVISESLRLYPPAVRVERTACQDITLGNSGIKLSRGCAVVIPVYAMHHDPEYFPDPEKFDPERFSDENIGTVRPYSYLPFGAGPRNCIGMRFALQALKTCLLHVVRSVELVRTENTKVPLKMVTTFSLLTAEDITVGVRNRNT